MVRHHEVEWPSVDRDTVSLVQQVLPSSRPISPSWLQPSGSPYGQYSEVDVITYCSHHICAHTRARARMGMRARRLEDRQEARTPSRSPRRVVLKVKVTNAPGWTTEAIVTEPWSECGVFNTVDVITRHDGRCAGKFFLTRSCEAGLQQAKMMDKTGAAENMGAPAFHRFLKGEDGRKFFAAVSLFNTERPGKYATPDMRLTALKTVRAFLKKNRRLYSRPSSSKQSRRRASTAWFYRMLIYPRVLFSVGMFFAEAGVGRLSCGCPLFVRCSNFILYRSIPYHRIADHSMSYHTVSCHIMSYRTYHICHIITFAYIINVLCYPMGFYKMKSYSITLCYIIDLGTSRVGFAVVRSGTVEEPGLNSSLTSHSGDDNNGDAILISNTII